MTSEFRDDVWVPIAFSCSSTTTSRPSSARRRAAASPTTPAPITTASTSMPSSSSGGPPTYLVRRERQHHFACAAVGAVADRAGSAWSGPLSTPCGGRWPEGPDEEDRAQRDGSVVRRTPK